MMERVLASAIAVPSAAVPIARRSAWRGRRQARPLEWRGDHRPSPMSKPRAARDERMAGVWGEASPQAPPEGAGGARRKARHDVRERGGKRVMMYGSEEESAS